MAGANKVNFDHTLSPPSGCDVNAVETNDGASPVVKQAFGVPRMIGDSGSGGEGGACSPPAAGDAAAGKFWKANGTWAVPAAAVSIPGPYADDTAAAGGGVLIGSPYYNSAGFVLIRLV